MVSLSLLAHIFPHFAFDFFFFFFFFFFFLLDESLSELAVESDDDEEDDDVDELLSERGDTDFLTLTGDLDFFLKLGLLFDRLETYLVTDGGGERVRLRLRREVLFLLRRGDLERVRVRLRL